MAEEPESKMLFDLRGRRKRVIQVICVILAFLMVASLVVIGMPGGMNPFSSGGSSVNQDAAELSVKRAERLETKLVTEPNNIDLRAELIRARVAAGGSLFDRDEDTGQVTITPEATEQYELAATSWEKYLKQAKKPDSSLAQLVSQTLYQLAQGSTVAQFESNIAAAAKAQRIVVAQAEKEAKQGDAPDPVAPLATLVELEYLAQNPEAAKAAGERALAMSSPSERKSLKQQLDAFQKQGDSVSKQLKAAKKQAKQDGGKSLEDPAGSLGTGSPLDTAGAQP